MWFVFITVQIENFHRNSMGLTGKSYKLHSPWPTLNLNNITSTSASSLAVSSVGLHDVLIKITPPLEMLTPFASSTEDNSLCEIH